MSKPVSKHPVDGQLMTVAEIAELMGTTKRALVCRRSRMGGISYQVLVDMHRQGQLLTRHDRWPRHLVDGEWITVREAAARVGRQPVSLARYMKLNGVPLSEAVDHYRKYQTGELACYSGRAPQAHWVNGRRLTCAQAAQQYHTTVNSLRIRMSKYKCSLQTAVRQLEARQKKQAERRLLEILMEGNHHDK